MGNLCCWCVKVEEGSANVTQPSSTRNRNFQRHVEPPPKPEPHPKPPKFPSIQETEFENEKNINLPYVTRCLMNYIIKTHCVGLSIPLNEAESFCLVSLFANSDEHKWVHNKFMDGSWTHFRVTEIARIENPYLFCTYWLKGEELRERHGYGVHEEILFHGTSIENVGQIAGKSDDTFNCAHYFSNNKKIHFS